MKQIVLQLSDKAFSELEQWIIVQGMCGSGGGLSDELTRRIVRAIKDGKDGVELVLKDEESASD